MSLQSTSVQIFCGAISHETNSFSPVPTDIENFKSNLLISAKELSTDRSEAWPAPLQGFREKATEKHWVLRQGLCASAMPSGPSSRASYESLRDQLISDLKAAMPVDAVALALHGAMMAQGYPDCEGDILKRVRHEVGPDVPVGVVLDPHAHLTSDMIESATVMVFFKEYPHTDVISSARDLMDLLEGCISGSIAPAPSVFDCRMISIYFTDDAPMSDFVTEMRELEQRDDVLSVSLIHGFPWGDTTDMGTQVLVYTNSAPATGAALSRSLGEKLFSIRDQTLPNFPGVDDAAKRVTPGDGGPLVLADVSDNPGGGAPGDSTHLLHALLKHGVTDIAIGPIWDPGAVKTSFALGVGATAHMRIGGKASPSSGPPLDINVEVVALCADATQDVDGWSWPMGDAALLRCGSLDLVVTTERLQAINTDIFTCLGLKPELKNVVVLKSAHHFFAAYGPIARSVEHVTSPGALFIPTDPARYRHLTRPKWPFDENPFPHG